MSTSCSPTSSGILRRGTSSPRSRSRCRTRWVASSTPWRPATPSGLSRDASSTSSKRRSSGRLLGGRTRRPCCPPRSRRTSGRTSSSTRSATTPWTTRPRTRPARPSSRTGRRRWTRSGRFSAAWTTSRKTPWTRTAGATPSKASWTARAGRWMRRLWRRSCLRRRSSSPAEGLTAPPPYRRLFMRACMRACTCMRARLGACRHAVSFSTF
mmetsp:Transcript_72394/g.223678  ORF Transcript_72394/g.223678 Transcript_72394/m.223678 type:complete len:211 (+) Transcript_72394:1649-2281(+)